jgi:hypothetical protein
MIISKSDKPDGISFEWILLLDNSISEINATSIAIIRQQPCTRMMCIICGKKLPFPLPQIVYAVQQYWLLIVKLRPPSHPPPYFHGKMSSTRARVHWLNNANIVSFLSLFIFLFFIYYYYFGPEERIADLVSRCFSFSIKLFQIWNNLA